MDDGQITVGKIWPWRRQRREDRAEGRWGRFRQEKSAGWWRRRHRGTASHFLVKGAWWWLVRAPLPLRSKFQSATISTLSGSIAFDGCIDDIIKVGGIMVHWWHHVYFRGLLLGGFVMVEPVVINDPFCYLHRNPYSFKEEITTPNWSINQSHNNVKISSR